MGTWAGVTSLHPERLGSQDCELSEVSRPEPLMGLRELGITCHQNSRPWTCKDWSPLDGTTISRCRQALQKLREAQGIQRLVGPQTGRASKRQQVSWTCPGEGTQHQPQTTSPSAEWFCRGWDLSVGRRGKGMRHGPLGVSPGTFCSLDNPEIDWLSWGFGCPADQT